MRDFEKRFVRFLIDEDVLQLGQFTLKDGRSSPYFLNFGLLKSGRQVHELGRFFAEGIIKLGMEKEFDILFGPAYKGIAIAAATAAALYAYHGQDKTFAYNRKESKAHGEGGMLVGLSKGETGRVLILDDVFSGGRAKDEALEVLSGLPGLSAAGILVGADRQEVNENGEKESEVYARRRGIRVSSLVSIRLVARLLEEEPSLASRYERARVEDFLLYLSPK